MDKAKTIKIDENSRIRIERDNYILEYRSKKGSFAGKQAKGFNWVIDGFFPDLVSLVQDWIKNAPVQRNRIKIKELKDIVTSIREAEQHISKLLTKKL